MITLLLLVPVNLAILDVNEEAGFLEGEQGEDPILKSRGFNIICFVPRSCVLNFFPCSPLPVGSFKPTGRNNFFPSAPLPLSPAYKVIVLQYGTMNYSL